MNTNILLNSDRQPRGWRVALMGAAALLMVGCTAGGDVLTPDDEDNDLVEITPTATINSVEASATRAATDNNEPFYFARCEETGVGTGAFDLYMNEVFKATRNSTTGALTFEKAQYYPTDGRKCRLTGLYPLPRIGTGMLQGIGFEWSIDGTTDIMTALNNDGTKSDKGIKTFAFKHRMAQLQFFPFSETADVAAQWGKITQIEVLTQSSGGVYQTFNDQFLGYADINYIVSGITTAAPFTPPSGGKASATVQAGGPCMIVPQKAASYVLSIRITTEKLGVKTVTRTGTLLENTPYRIYLRLAGQAIEIAAVENLAMEEWQEGQEQSGTTGTTYPYVTGGNTIVFQDANGSSGNYNYIHQPWLNNDMPYGTDWTAHYGAVPKKMEVAAKTVQNTWNDEWSNHTKCPAPWRMPTVWETFAIRDLRDRLVAVDYINTDLLTASGVYNPSSSAWYVPINSTGTAMYTAWKTISKGSNANIRCVKDIE